MKNHKGNKVRDQLQLYLVLVWTNETSAVHCIVFVFVRTHACVCVCVCVHMCVFPFEVFTKHKMFIKFRAGLISVLPPMSVCRWC